MKRMLTAFMIGLSLMIGTLSGNVYAQAVRQVSRHEFPSWKMRCANIKDDTSYVSINVFDENKLIISDTGQDNIRPRADVIDINEDRLSEILVTRYSGGNC